MFFSKDEINGLSLAGGGICKVSSASDAYSFCERIAKRHYENFPVGSIAVPKNLRHHFYAIYAYSRLADDIADEFAQIAGNKDKALQLLDNLSRFADDSFASNSGNPIFWALNITMNELAIPSKPLQDLTIAFQRDINFVQAETMEDLYDYCKYSANPVGELVLRLFGEFNSQTADLSDKICTALQLVNFWQDISEDIKINRLYIPKNILEKHSIDLKDLFDNRKSVKLQNALNDLFEQTYLLFDQGQQLVALVQNRRLKLELRLIINSGLKILSKLVRLRSDLMFVRPKLNRADVLIIFLKTLFFKSI